MTSFIMEPMLAANAAVFAIKNATVEGKITVIVLLLLSLFSLSLIHIFQPRSHRSQHGNFDISRTNEFGL